MAALVGVETYASLMQRRREVAEEDATLIAPAYGSLSLETGTAEGVA